MSTCDLFCSKVNPPPILVAERSNTTDAKARATDSLATNLFDRMRSSFDQMRISLIECESLLIGCESLWSNVRARCGQTMWNSISSMPTWSHCGTNFWASAETSLSNTFTSTCAIFWWSMHLSGRIALGVRISYCRLSQSMSCNDMLTSDTWSCVRISGRLRRIIWTCYTEGELRHKMCAGTCAHVWHARDVIFIGCNNFNLTRDRFSERCLILFRVSWRSVWHIDFSKCMTARKCIWCSNGEDCINRFANYYWGFMEFFWKVRDFRERVRSGIYREGSVALCLVHF